MMSQWNVVHGAGAIGLKYESLPAVYESIGLSPDERADAFNGLRIMEDVALEVMRANSK